MQTLMHNSDLRRLFAGVAASAIAGVLLGAVMQPNLDEDAIEGPQQLLRGGGERTYADASDPGIGAYEGRIPEYVIGTDATRPRTIEAATYELPEEADPADDAVAYAVFDEPPQVAPARWRDLPRPAPRYPSAVGGVYHESDLPQPPELPPADEEAWAPA